MKTSCIVLLALTLAGVCLAEEPKTAVAAALKAPGTENFTALRMAFAARPDFNPYWDVEDERMAVMEALKSGDAPKLLALSKPWLEKVPVDADVHLARAQALKKMGDWAGSMYHFHCFYGLLHSIAASGDGKTMKTAYKVISVSEEYYLLDEIGAELTTQSLVTPCDKMHVKLRDGSETDLYFDVSISLAATERQIKAGAEKDEVKKKR